VWRNFCGCENGERGVEKDRLGEDFVVVLRRLGCQSGVSYSVDTFRDICVLTVFNDSWKCKEEKLASFCHIEFAIV
jgi:hypothetical protein